MSNSFDGDLARFFGSKLLAETLVGIELGTLLQADI